MYKNIGLAVLFIALVLSFGMRGYTECPKVTVEPYKQNQMIDGCVMQKTASGWVKTCG